MYFIGKVTMYMLFVLSICCLDDAMSAHKEKLLLKTFDETNWEALLAITEHLSSKKKGDTTASVRLQYITGDVHSCKEAIIHNLAKLGLLESKIPEIFKGSKYTECSATLMTFAVSLQSIYKVVYPEKPLLILPSSNEEILDIVKNLHLELYLCSSYILENK